MNNIKRTRADSKKKIKVTAADVKAHHAHAHTKRKRVKVTKKKTQSVNPPILLINPALNPAPILNPRASSNVSDVGNLPLPKTKVFHSVSKDKVNLSFRIGVDNYTNMVPQLSKEIHSNFNYQYKRRSVSSPRCKSRVDSSGNASSEPEVFIEDNLTLSNYNRCYVEDFMTRTVGESLIVLLPHRYQSDPFSPWYEMMSSNMKSMEITFSKKRYIGYVESYSISSTKRYA